MSDNYVGEIRLFTGTYTPTGWADCDGAILPIDENEVLFNLIGTTYGGDGESTFALPDFRGRAPMHWGTGPGLGYHNSIESGGVETVSLTLANLPTHGHQPAASIVAGSAGSPAGAVWATVPDTPYASAPATRVPMHAAALPATGGGQPHENRPPYVALRFIIALFGQFPLPD
ncbi:phage tail protein [Dactylosporangium sp. CS-047395]|uniref:phage tail protein n=1 Tax=Dactylosporangium sp. CS-047395 TaxID=3239936 RepID=UPI003D8AB5FA